MYNLRGELSLNCLRRWKSQWSISDVIFSHTNLEKEEEEVEECVFVFGY